MDDSQIRLATIAANNIKLRAMLLEAMLDEKDFSGAIEELENIEIRIRLLKTCFDNV